nr:MAG TPA: hypothetical protein [Caudoviricetes sp.]
MPSTRTNISKELCVPVIPIFPLHINRAKWSMK